MRRTSPCLVLVLSCFALASCFAGRDPVAADGEADDGTEGEGEGDQGEDEVACEADADCGDGEVCASILEVAEVRFCRPPAAEGERCGGFDGDTTVTVACADGLVCERDPASIVEEETCVPVVGRANGAACDTNDQCLSGACRLGEQCVAADCTQDADCEAGLVCRVSSCDGAVCTAPAGEAERCSGDDGLGCSVTHACDASLVCTTDGLCD